jgi:DNA-binding GntR family transcriptional regulator
MLNHGYMLARAPRLRAVAWANRVALHLAAIVQAIEDGDAQTAGDAMHDHFSRHEGGTNGE